MTSPSKTPHERLHQIALQRLESLQRAGVLQIPRVAAMDHPATDLVEQSAEQTGAAQADAAQSGTAQSGTAQAGTAQTAKEPALPNERKTSSPKSDQASSAGKPPTRPSIAARRKELAVIQQEVAGCTVCDELAENRTQTVFGVGNPAARLCFFGEAPGADEDREGEPFVGRAGKLLNDIISKGMGLTREDVFILNVLKCRPPGNRNPAPDEVANCRHFFERQLETIQPEFICCLGAIAAQSLLETNTPVGRLRGAIHDYKGIKVVVTYHPAYLLRNPAAKNETWKDIKILLEGMGLPVPQRS